MSIHPTAIVDSKAVIGKDVTIGPHCVIEGEVRIGDGTRLWQNVYVTGWTEIGESCELHPNVIVGHAPQDIKYGGERSYVRIGRKTILRENVTIHRPTTPEAETVVGEECFLLAGAHVGHDCKIGDRVTLINNVMLGGHVQIGARVTVGGGTGIHQFVRIGELAMLAGCGRVVMDVVPFSLTDVEGRIAGLNRIGLRRAEVPEETVDELRRAFRILFSTVGAFREKIEEVGAFVRTPQGEALAEFLRQHSRRGIAGRSRRGHDE